LPETNGPEKILVAEDDELVRQLIVFKLRAEGFQVLEALDGNSALETIAQEHVDAVVLDGMMPGKDGFYVLQRMKEDSATSNIPVIFLTARGRDEDVVKGLNLGADEYIVKPCPAPLSCTTRL